MTALGTVQELVRYPVKSMQGEPLDRATLSRHGVEADRALAVRDLATGKIASAKQPRQWHALLDCHAHLDGGEVRVRLPDGCELAVGDELDAALSALVARDVAVVEAVEGHLGAYDSTWPRVAGVTIEGEHEFPIALGTQAVTFADVAALHLLTTTTLARLAQLAPEVAVDPRRFRPNLVVATGDDPDFAEDDWVGRTLRIGDQVEAQITLRTPRCVMTTLAQPGLERAPGVLRAAAENRHDVGGVAVFACAGVYAEVVTPGTVSVGDELTLA